MRGWPWIAIVTVLVAGCLQEGAPDGEDKAPARLNGRPVDPLQGNDTQWAWFSATGHMESDGAIEMRFLLEEPTTCTLFQGAHHKTDATRDAGPYLAYKGPEDTYWSYDPAWRSMPWDSVRVSTGATGHVDPGGTLYQATAEALTGGRETFTSWRGQPDWGLGPGEHAIRAWMNDGLVDEGGDIVDGGSIHLAVGCDAPVANATAHIDDEPRWFDAYRAQDSTGVSTGFHGLHEGSMELETKGPGTTIRVETCLSEGSIQFSGIIEETLSWTIDPDPLAECKIQELTGGTGELAMSWETIGDGVGFLAEIASWEDMEPRQDEPHAWPWE